MRRSEWGKACDRHESAWQRQPIRLSLLAGGDGRGGAANGSGISDGRVPPAGFQRNRDYTAPIPCIPFTVRCIVFPFTIAVGVPAASFFSILSLLKGWYV